MIRKISAAWTAAVIVMALAVPVLADHDGGVNEPWVVAMNQETYWEDRFGPGAECTKYNNHSGYIPASYEAAVSKAGTTVRVYNPAPDNTFIDGPDHKDISWVMKCDVAEPVDYCDAANKPGGVSLADWLEKAGNPDCIDLEVATVCGSATGTITRNETPYGWGVAFEVSPATYNLGEAEFGSIAFAEDFNGGSVDVDFYLVGPESDYGVISGEPNFWQENAGTVTVDTDCVPEETTTTTTVPETTTTTVPETTTTTVPETTTTTVQDTTTTTVANSTTTTVGDTTSTTAPAVTTPDVLPFTGNDTTLLVIAALGMLSLGGIMAWVFRDRLTG